MRILLLIMILGNFMTAHAGINVVHTSLQAFAKKGKDKQVRVAIGLCERGSCRNLARRGGYTVTEWNKIASLCRRHESYFPLRTIARYSGEIVGVVGKGPIMAVASFVLASFGVSKEEERAIRSANKSLGHVFNKSDMTLSVSGFYHLTEGIKTCSAKYDDHLAHVAMGKRLMNK